MQCVNINGTVSLPLEYKPGIPQGSVLGPLLFCLYINELPTVYKQAECQLYADDAVIYVTAKTPEKAGDHSKTVSMCFSLRQKCLNDFKIHINQIPINNGVTMDSYLKFEAHIKNTRLI